MSRPHESLFAGKWAAQEARRDSSNLDFGDVPIAQPNRWMADDLAAGRTKPGSLIPYEHDVLAAVLVALRLHEKVAWVQRMNSGKFRLPGKDGRLQWVRFGFRGMADISGQLKAEFGGKRLEVEVKAPNGKTKRERLADQIAFLASVRQAGGVAFFASSVDDVMRELA